jgi:hypothetical protein
MSRRVNLTLTDKEYEILKAYSLVTKTTPTGVIHSIFQELIPVFQTVVSAIEVADKDKNASLSKLQAVLIDRIHSAAGISSELQKEMNS